MASFITTLSKYGIRKPGKLLHIGANYGQEAKEYATLDVTAWHIEAIPEVFSKLSENIAHLESQHAVCACLSSIEGQKIEFNIASNHGQSSSILPLGRHEYSYPFVQYIDTVGLTTETVDGLIRDGKIPFDIDFILIDAQGAELMILEGAKQLLSTGKIAGLLIETAVEALYEGGSTYLEIGAFLKEFDLHLCYASFNSAGWTDALYAKPYWRAVTPEIKISGENIAPHAEMTQSSTYGSYPALTAFTGIRTGGFSFHTNLEHGPWIKLGFNSTQSFHEILVFNRIDACQERSANLDVLISPDNLTWDLIHENTETFGGIDGMPLRISCKGLRAQYILFRLRDKNYLHLDSVEIYS